MLKKLMLSCVIAVVSAGLAAAEPITVAMA